MKFNDIIDNLSFFLVATTAFFSLIVTTVDACVGHDEYVHARALRFYHPIADTYLVDDPVSGLYAQPAAETDDDDPRSWWTASSSPNAHMYINNALTGNFLQLYYTGHRYDLTTSQTLNAYSEWSVNHNGQLMEKVNILCPKVRNTGPGSAVKAKDCDAHVRTQMSIEFVQREYVLVEQRTHDNNQNYCEETYGTNLATITNDDENQAALAKCSESTQDRCWIGLQEVTNGVLTTWVSGKCFSLNGSYVNWQSGTTDGNYWTYATLGAAAYMIKSTGEWLFGSNMWSGQTAILCDAPNVV